MTSRNGIIQLLRKELSRVMSREMNQEKRTCACGCGAKFTTYRADHFFYKRSCYARYHRLPGQVRHLLKNWE